MERVFAKSPPPSAGSNKFRKILLGKQKTKPQYFPYGGGGDQSDQFATQFNSYEPEELMLESHVPLEEDRLQIFKRSARRILVRDSKYDIPDQLVPPNSRKPSYDPPTPDKFRAVSTKSVRDHFGLEVPQTLQQAVALIRQIARGSLILRPVDKLADFREEHWAPIIVASVELWLLMLGLNVVALGAQIICTPALWILKLIFYFIR